MVRDDILRGMEMVATTSRKSVSEHRAHQDVQHRSVRWDKKMSNNCAAALLFYTMMQIFFVLRFIETRGMSIAPYFGLIRSSLCLCRSDQDYRYGDLIVRFLPELIADR